MAGHACRSTQDVYRLRPSDCIGIIRGRSVYHHQRLRDHARFSSRLVAPLLTNPLVLYLGRISCSLYLSHILVIIVIQYALLTWVPDLSRMVHFGVLLVCTTAVTIAVSTVLYRYLEVPGFHAVVSWPGGLPPNGKPARRTRSSSPGRLSSILFGLVIQLLDRSF